MEMFFVYLSKVSFILIAFYLVYQGLLKNETLFNANRLFLLSGIICAVALPHIYITKITYIVLFDTNSIPAFSDSQVLLHNDFSIIVWPLLFLMYMLGVLILSTRFVVQLKSLLSLIRTNKRIGEKQMGKYSLIEVQEDMAPFSFFNCIVYNPRLHSDEEIQMIIKHEKVHVAQFHTIDNLVINLLSIMLWFNPFVWLYKKKVQQNLEFIADYSATQEMESKKDYQLTLLKISLSNPYTITNNFYQSLIKKRIVMLNTKKSNNNRIWKMVVILPCIALFMWSFNTKEVILPEPTNANNTAEEITDSDILHTIQFVVNKDASEEDIKKISNILQKEYELKTKFKNIRRNDDQEIIAISVHISGKNGSVDYQIDDDEPIQSFVILYDSKTEKVKIGKKDQSRRIYISEKADDQHEIRTEIVEIHPDQDENHEFIFIGNDEESKKIVIETDSDNTQSKTEKSFRFMIDDNGKEPLIYIDGKKVSRKEMKSLASDKIATIDVMKGEKAVKKYGEKAKNGVIVIKTK